MHQLHLFAAYDLAVNLPLLAGLNWNLRLLSSSCTNLLPAPRSCWNFNLKLYVFFSVIVTILEVRMGCVSQQAAGGTDKIYAQWAGGVGRGAESSEHDSCLCFDGQNCIQRQSCWAAQNNIQGTAPKSFSSLIFADISEVRSARLLFYPCSNLAYSYSLSSSINWTW